MQGALPQIDFVLMKQANSRNANTLNALKEWLIFIG